MRDIAIKEDALNGEKILRHLNWRYAVKGFDPEKKVSGKDWEALEKAAILAPSSYGLQPFRLVVITDPDMKERLRPACNNQPQITECSHLVVFAARKQFREEHVDEFIELISDVRGTPREKLQGLATAVEGTRRKYEDEGVSKFWSQRQAYISLGFLLETAALMGIDACPMEGFDPAKVDEILGLEDYTATALCAVGYRTGDDWLAPLKKVRFPAEKMVIRF